MFAADQLIPESRSKMVDYLQQYRLFGSARERGNRTEHYWYVDYEEHEPQQIKLSTP